MGKCSSLGFLGEPTLDLGEPTLDLDLGEPLFLDLDLGDPTLDLGEPDLGTLDNRAVPKTHFGEPFFPDLDLGDEPLFLDLDLGEAILDFSPFIIEPIIDLDIY